MGKRCVREEVETRGFKGPRAYDETGVPLNFDDQSIFKERIRRDRADPNILHDEITTIDHPLTRPWTVDKKYVLDPNPQADWAGVLHRRRQRADHDRQGKLLSERRRDVDACQKNQAPPDLRYFKPTQK
jgi:hypothetical protein